MGSRRQSRSLSVAALPFTNMSPDPENEFFRDGISEEIINVLTRVNGLQVTARTSRTSSKPRTRSPRPSSMSCAAIFPDAEDPNPLLT